MVRLVPTKEHVRVHLTKQEYRTFLDCTPDRTTRLATRIEAKTSIRAGYVVTLKPKDIFVPDNPDVEIAFIRVRGSKDTTEGENVLGGSARITWMPQDLLEDLRDFCGRNDIDENEEIISFDYERLRQNINEAADNMATKTGNKDYSHITSHDFRIYYATHMIRREQVDKEIVKEMGGWDSDKAIEPYLGISQPIDIQNELARAGVVQRDVPAPPQRDEFNAIYNELREIKRLIGVSTVKNTGIEELTLDDIEAVKEEALDGEDESGHNDDQGEQMSLERLGDKIGLYVPPFGITTLLSRLLNSRVTQEYHDCTKDGQDLAGTKGLAGGALMFVVAVLTLAVDMAHEGVYLTSGMLSVQGPVSQQIGILFGAVLGIVIILLTDYRVRAEPDST